jgi:hypothetical protein
MDRTPDEVESYRDSVWCREPDLRVEAVSAASRFIDRVGFCSALTDARRAGPSLYIAVCGRRDAFMPRNVQKDPEARLAWQLKDELVRLGRVYYSKIKGGRSMFVAPRLIPHFNTLFGVRRSEETLVLSHSAQSILKALRKEWEMGTSDLRRASGVTERKLFNKAIDELQRSFKVVPSEVVYKPTFTYIWTTAESRFGDEFEVISSREAALTEIARAYLKGAGMTLRGELARVTGLSKPDAGLGNWALVDEGFATRLSPGVYQLTDFD